MIVNLFILIPILHFILIAIGSLLTIWGYMNFRKMQILKANGIQTTGIITEIKEVFDGIDSNLFYCILEFETIEGKTISEKTNSRYTLEYKIGQEVDIFYNKLEPTDFTINGSFEYEHKNYWFMFGGISIILVGILS